MKKIKKKFTLDLDIAIWVKAYEALIKHNVKFPKGFSGLVASYAGLMAINETLKEYKTKSN